MNVHFCSSVSCFAFKNAVFIGLLLLTVPHGARGADALALPCSDLSQALLAPVEGSYTNELLVDVVHDLSASTFDIIAHSCLSTARVTSVVKEGSTRAQALVDVSRPRTLAWSPSHTLLFIGSGEDTEHAVEMAGLLRQVAPVENDDEQFSLLCFHGLHIERIASLLRDLHGIPVTNRVAVSSQAGLLDGAELRDTTWREWLWASIVLSDATLSIEDGVLVIDQRRHDKPLERSDSSR